MDKINNQKMKGKGAILLFSFASLFCTLLSFLSVFFVEHVEVTNNGLSHNVQFQPYNFLALFSTSILFLLPAVLFLLFFTKLYKYKKSKILLAILLLVWSVPHFLVGGFPLGIAQVVAVILIIIGLLGAFRSKYIYIVLITMILVISMISCVNHVGDRLSATFIEGLHISVLFVVLRLLILSLLDIAILIYLTNSEICLVKRNKKSSPENELKALKEKLEQNLISQEEYDAQRAEIISKL